MSVRIKTDATTKAAFMPVFVTKRFCQPPTRDCRLGGRGHTTAVCLGQSPADVTQASTGTTGVSRHASAATASSAQLIGALNDPQIYLKTCTKGGCVTKFLDIVDFINLVEPIVED